MKLYPVSILDITLCETTFQPGKCHQLLKVTTGSGREASRLPVKLKIATETYILQYSRAAFSQNPVEPAGLLCNKYDEKLGPLFIGLL